MKGLELSRQYYEAYGRQMIREKFEAYEERIAVGLVGQGSECFGFDDEYSRDHDFGPSFCMWLTEEDYQKIGAALETEYEKLPKTFMGFEGRRLSSQGGGRVGVLETGSFYQTFIGSKALPKTLFDWLFLPERYLAAATNGNVFRDDLGAFSKIRNGLLPCYPEDVRIKKIAARAAGMAQAGQYNYARCMKRGETVAARLALEEFMKTTISMVYLLNKRYTPFYKWMFRGMQSLPVLSGISGQLIVLAETGASKEAWERELPYGTLNLADKKVEAVEIICGKVVEELKKQGLTDRTDDFLENHTEEIMSRIKDPQIRSLHVMQG